MGNKDIKGFEGEYQISTTGDVYSLKFGKRRLMKLSKNTKGYLMVHLCKDGKQKTFLVHRLVAEAFLPNSENLPEINHKNEDKTDNRVSNLEFCDRKYNNNYGSRNKKISNSLKGRKLSEETKRKMIGRVVSEETRQKISIGITGIKRSEETKKKLSDSHNKKPVLQYTKDGLLIASYPSTMEVQRQTGFDNGYISSCCRGKYKSAYNYIWKWADC